MAAPSLPSDTGWLWCSLEGTEPTISADLNRGCLLPSQKGSPRRMWVPHVHMVFETGFSALAPGAEGWERQRQRQGLGSGNVMVRTVSPACLSSHCWSKGCRRLMLQGAETRQRFGEAEQAMTQAPSLLKVHPDSLWMGQGLLRHCPVKTKGPCRVIL